MSLRTLAAAFAAAAAAAALAASESGLEYIPPELQDAGDFRHTVEVRSDGTVWVSGRNGFGQLGDGTNINRATPTRVKSAVKFTPGLPVRVTGLGRRPAALDVLDGQGGVLEAFEYDSFRWRVRMDDYAGNVRVLVAKPQEIEAQALDLDVPPLSTMPPGGSRRRSGCRVTTEAKKQVWVVHDDGTRNLVQYPDSQPCITQALVVPAETLAMYLPRYGEASENYPLNEDMSVRACAQTPPCTACNTYDATEICPNNARSCNPPLGVWQHETCKLKFTPGVAIYPRQLRLTPQLELNWRTGHLVRMDLRFGMEWETKLSPLSCVSGACDSGNVVALMLEPQHLELDGESYGVATGAFHTLFLWKDSSVWATGRNNEGQLGDNTTQSRNFAKYVLWGVQAVAAGSYHSVFLLLNGTVSASGRNKEGQLGDGSGTSRATPVRVLSGAVQIAAGAYHSVYLLRDGTAWAAGSNTYGQLGDGSTLSRRVPVKVFDNVSSISARDYFTLFVMINPMTNATTVWSAGKFDSGLGRDRSDWSPLQFYNESEVQRMALVM